MDQIEKETQACPFCKESIRLTATRCKHCHAAVAPDSKAHGGVCPFCKEEIKVDAIRCRHCKSDVRRRMTLPPSGTVPYAATMPPGCTCNRGSGAGLWAAPPGFGNTGRTFPGPGGTECTIVFEVVAIPIEAPDPIAGSQVVGIDLVWFPKQICYPRSTA
jgi:hypothetical protein